MQLYLIRHAESENNAKPIYQRIEDPPITARGRLQSQHLANWTESLKIDTLITSPFLRSLQTTRSIVDRTPQKVHVWHNVFERGGCFRGHGPNATEGGIGLGPAGISKHATAVANDCIIDETILESGWWGGRNRETDDEAEVRAIVVMDRFVDTFGARDCTVVAVIHADFKRCLLRQMISAGTDVDSLGPMVNTGVTKLRYNGQHWQLDTLNSISHLPSRLITGVET
ncbi:histidine phosphatase family protein [Novipirellula artificiosorum]|uniref:Putative phosphoserine phosphatase 2 n=1 Tax=Novipirellula artificiosorum TaxID=2528016 RepID=A0A5C6DVN6_9BACT|nr:histidine phosphatase family protein [Novipirellula artificiosorum]TWU40770.1 putative phosphoserine phosphatase 2 [Novipirellula artificiosorum]